MASQESRDNQIISTLEDIRSTFDRASITLASLIEVLKGRAPTLEFDPKDPANKFEIGGLMKLTERGIEICYRLFDEGKSRYAVASLMDISFGAATHRFHAWEKAGGINRARTRI